MVRDRGRRLNFLEATTGQSQLQPDPFTAAWLLGSVAALSLPGVESVSYFVARVESAWGPVPGLLPVLSPNRSPNPTCDSHRTGLSTVLAVDVGVGLAGERESSGSQPAAVPGRRGRRWPAHRMRCRWRGSAAPLLPWTTPVGFPWRDWCDGHCEEPSRARWQADPESRLLCSITPGTWRPGRHRYGYTRRNERAAMEGNEVTVQGSAAGWGRRAARAVTSLCEVGQHFLALPSQCFSLGFQFGGSPCEV